MKRHDALALAALLTGLETFRHCAGAGALPEALRSPVLKPDDVAIIEEAARLAAPAMSRDEDTPSLNSERLEAVTERIAITENGLQRRNDSGARYYYPLAALSLSEQIFPAPLEKAQDQPASQYRALWGDFVAEVERLPSGAQARFVSLTHLLHKYTWCIPAAQAPTISLYDLSRATAALAVCLAEAGQETDTPFLLIEGGISGIQRFIYNPTFNGQELYDGMARRLRGRSFYLNLLVKTVADYLSETLDLYCVNMLWATGGHFLIVAPNTAETWEKLQAARHTIQRWLWREYRGALGVVIADLPARRDELKDFGQLCARLEQISAQQKLQQAELPLSFGDNAPDEAWADAWVLKMQDDICRDTGRDLSENDVEISAAGQFVDEEEGETSAPRSSQSLLFDAIGRALINARAIQLRREDDWLPGPQVARLPRDAKEAERLTESLHNVSIEFRGLSRTWLLTKETSAATGAEFCLRLGNHDNINLDFLPGKTNHAIAYGFELMATAVETELDRKGRKRIKPFNKLAEAAVGAPYLGALRMDVDNLGYVFAQGLSGADGSIAKIANLSRMFDWFFSGYLNTLIDGRPLYTTYAGGDDLFVVGAWNEALDLANEIQRDFRAFCGHHPDLHISGGLVLCKGKYPIGRAAEDAGVMLDEIAKQPRSDRIAGDSNKNALAFLERKIGWKRWQSVRELGDQLILVCGDGGEDGKKVSRSFVYNLLELYRNHIDPERDPARESAGEDLIWLPRFKFSLVRNVKNDELRVELLKKIEQQKHYLSVLAGYVLLKTRSLARDKTGSEIGVSMQTTEEKR